MNNWEWHGPNGQRSTGLSELMARSRVKARGGIAVDMPELEPIVPTVATQVYLPAATSEAVGAEALYGPGRFNGD